MGVKNNIEALMKKQGLNASTLADKANMPKSTVYALLKRDSSNISYQTAQKLAFALNCSESDILDLEGSDKEYYEGLKKKIINLTQELNDLKNNEDYIEIPTTDDEYNEIIIKENANQFEIDYIEAELEGLSFEIERLLTALEIPVKPFKYAEIVNYYKSLNDIGKLEAVKRVEELTHIEKYTKED